MWHRWHHIPISTSFLLERSSALGSGAVTRHNKPKVRKKIRMGKWSNAKRNGKQGVHRHTCVSCKFLFVNIRGLKSKADSLYQLIEEQDIDILLLAETKVYTNYLITFIFLEKPILPLGKQTKDIIC